MTPGTSVVVSTYERPDALRAVLHGLLIQRSDDFEVLVADDGSGEETAEVVEEARRTGFGDRLRHVHQADEGFRLARIRNLAVRESRGERLVFLDGDCVPRQGFVDSHAACGPGRATCGRRALLSEGATRRWLADDADSRMPGVGGQTRMWSRGDLNRPPWLADPPLAFLGRALSWRRFRGMNHGVHRRDYLAVDGNDQAFEGWGFEDSDLAIRLQNAGVRLVWAGRGSTVVHLWHPEADRSCEGDNRRRLENLQREARTRAGAGLSTLDPPGSVPAGEG